MKNMLKLVVATLLTVGAALPSAAHEVIYSAPLLGSSEAPANASPGHGSAKVTIDFDLLTMRVQVSFADLLGNVTAAHIHCCTDPGTNTGVATQLPSFIGFPTGVTGSTYDHTFNMALASSYNPSFVSNHGATISTAFNDLVQGLDAGRAYLNVHTNLFPGGEIRALLVPAAVPVPGAAMMFAPALAALALGARRRMKRRAAPMPSI